MSTIPPPPPPSPPAGPWVKVLIGCGMGCLLLLVLLVAGSYLLWTKVGAPMIEQGQRLEGAAQAAEAAQARMREVEAAHPPRLPEDGAAAELTAEDVDRYLRIRRDLAAPLAQVEEALRRTTPSAAELTRNPLSGALRMAGGMLAGMADAMAARNALLEVAHGSLTREGVGPTDFARMAELVEWRFLGRPEAMPLGLPAADRDEALADMAMLRFMEPFLAAELPGSWNIDGRDRAQMQRELDQAKARLEAHGAKARERTALTETTRASLEARRAELEALGTAGLVVLATPLTEEPTFLRALERRADVHVGTGEEGGHEPTPVPPPVDAAEPAAATAP